ncbi:hypothetical protein [Salinarimonas soli]|uniref:Uncharacterized protein n=1 Tax=Salinarimonas soli TaxID=1638099 RepID=A0A5B2VA66_9HYPH|nr:hypothetical protein [Salinarimonas soli]KAA2235884.1 hypothetical protein F0L46_17755 [Salinarimonas soli]
MTRQVLLGLEITDCQMAVKHVSGAFGTVESGCRMMGGPVSVNDRQSGESRVFGNIDQLVAAGWVID